MSSFATNPKTEGSPVDTSGLREAGPPVSVNLEPGDSYHLTIHPVAKRIGEGRFRMLSYNGSIPGPILRVKQGSTITVNVTNETEMDTTVHWHGLRLENAYDGVPHDTQAPIPPHGRYTHRLTFPDAGLFWYHPHMREDYAQELGLYGNIIVEPSDPDFWPPVDREVVLTLDDILIEDGAISPHDPSDTNFTAMGRYGNVLLIQGETKRDVRVQRGEVVRFLLTDTANTRVFKFRVSGHRMKLVGSDGGRYERDEWVDDVIVAPSERAIVDVLFDNAGSFALEHVTPGKTYLLGEVTVIEPPVELSAAERFEELRVNADMVHERARAARFFDAEPDKTLALIAEMDFEESGVAVVYVCPMHPEVVADEPGKCPKCSMKLMPSQVGAGSAHPPHAHEHDDTDAIEGGIEWEDLMFEVNRTTTTKNMRWKAVDRETGKENHAIDWTFKVGDQIKIRVVNEMDSDHPMHHPFHIHGERFLVLARDGVPESNLVWKDTVLIPTGQVVDILMDASNPGLWMAHCHIAEHMEAGMMFSFRVVCG